MTIRQKTLLWFLIPSILIAISTAMFCYFYTRKIVERNIFDQLEIAAGELQVNVRVFLEAKKGRVLDFSSDGFVRDCTEVITGRTDSFQFYIERLNNHLVENKKPLDIDILEILIIDLEGEVIASTENYRIGKDVSGEVYFTEAINRGSGISDLSYSPDFMQNTFVVSRLLFSKEHRNSIGIIANRFSGDTLNKIAFGGISKEFGEEGRRKGMGETGETYIVNHDRLMITESRFVADAILKQVVDTEGVRHAFDNGVGMTSIYADYRGIPTLGVSKYFEEMDWVIVAEKDVSEAFAPVVWLRNFFIIVGASGILIMVMISILISTGITKSIKKLIRGTKRIAGGDLEHPIKINEMGGEIKELGKSFNMMMRELGKSTRENRELFLQVKKGRDELIEKARELEKANKEMEDFVYLTSHDLKEPLFVIGGFTSRLSLAYNDVLDDKGRMFIRRIKVNVEKMNQRIHEIMEVLRAGKIEYNFKDNDSGAIVKDVIGALQEKILENKITLSVQDNLPAIFCDEVRIKDVFLNLLTNAIKYMGNGNKLNGDKGGLVKEGLCSSIRIDCKKNGEYYKFIVEDTGIGIQADYQKQIFKIFKRLNDIDVEGTGIGLSIVKKIIERHKGDIWVESPVRDGKGSRFCFTIPKIRGQTSTFNNKK